MAHVDEAARADRKSVVTTAPISNFDADRPPQLACLPAPPPAQNFQFERPDWALFRQIPTLSQKAGVPTGRLRRLVLKELADNALDVAANVTCGTTDDGFYYIQDDGPGLSPDAVGRLFSINRPLMSSKLWRMPTRGALGNGLRVVAGAVAASDGELRVHTRGRRLTLQPKPDGSTAVVPEVIDFPVGTRVEIKFGAAMPEDDCALTWTHAAIALHKKGETYRGRTSPHWYNTAVFHEMLLAGGDRYVRDLITEFDGCTGATAGKITAGLKGRVCKSVTRAEADALLTRAKSVARLVKPHRLGYVGADAFINRYYARTETVAKIDGAGIPAVIEVWAHTTTGRSSARFYVNRTPITGDVSIWRDGKEIGVKGCGLVYWIEISGKFEVGIIVSVIAPYVPITTDGKEPNLSCFSHDIREAIAKAIRAAKRASSDGKADEKVSQKDIVHCELDDAVAEVSGGGAHRFNLRQIFYHLRPMVKEECGNELRYPNFTQIITEYEAEQGEIEGMLRDPRGTIYIPHTGEEIPLGTRAVENFERPPWTFNKLVYLEKEGFFEILKTARWPEQNDCALLTSKGYASRAVRDLIDELADSDEPITVFCVHDADSAGTLIFQALQEETAARPRRRIEVVNLGLEPWEAVEMGLDVEWIDTSERHRPVAEYVKRHEGDWEDWEAWLQTRRIELNAMTSPQFIAWLDQKMADHAGKVIPPADIVHDRIREDVEATIKQAIREKILRESNIAERVAAAMADVAWPDDTEVTAAISEALIDAPHKSWSDVVDDIVSDIASRG